MQYFSEINEENSVLAFTQDGKPIYALMNWKHYEEIIETLEVLADDELLNSINSGIQDLKFNKLTSIADLENEIL